ncbi:MAG: hypothetical protein KGL19_12030 [Bacteroidota bacterium]|nr:hypothetical protein [Bacteroidota bacterium]
MKKIFTLLTAFSCMAILTFAQEKKDNKTKAPAKKESVKPVEKAKPAATAKPEEKHLKKDGTPDKRFKENKGKEEEKHLKKDGTPDKRFKENKEPAKKKG